MVIVLRVVWGDVFGGGGGRQFKEDIYFCAVLRILLYSTPIRTVTWDSVSTLSWGGVGEGMGWGSGIRVSMGWSMIDMGHSNGEIGVWEASK